MIRFLEKQEEYQIFSKKLYQRIKNWFIEESEVEFDVSILFKWNKSDIFQFNNFHDRVRLEVLFYDDRQSICFLAGLGSDMSYFSDSEKILTIRQFRDDLESLKLQNLWIFKIIRLFEKEIYWND